MKKYLMLRVLFLFAATGLIFANSGCTSKKTDDSQAAVENADIEKIEAEGMDLSADSSLDAAMGVDAGDTAASAPTIDESAPAPEVTATTEETPTAPPTTPPTDVVAIEGSMTETPPPTVEASAAPTIDETASQPPPETMPTETASIETSTTDTATTAPIESAPVEPTPETAPTMSEQAKAEPVPSAPKVATGTLKKVALTMPHQLKDGGWVNTVYVARPKETIKSISQKIYGTDKTKELKKIAENSYLKSRSVKPGDKIYYVSPNRPDDSTKTILYYEDMGMVPETYVAKKGDNLRKISKELLGYDNAWKEVWTSNGVESKTALKEGETLRYWKAEEVAAATPAIETKPEEKTANLIDASQAPTAVAEAVEAAPAGAGSTETLQPPPTTADAQAVTPPPAEGQMAQAELPPPPTEGAELPPPPTEAAQAELPPPPAELAPPPPPPPPADEAVAAAPEKQKINLDEAAAQEEESEELDSDTMMSLGALGVLVALLAFVIIRKKKQKAAQMEQTQANA